jgi:hypothetical protein
MNTLFEADAPSIGRPIAVVVAGVLLVGSAVWLGIALGLIVASGH